MEFSGEGLCFDDAHGDFGPSALTNVESLLKGMELAILRSRLLEATSHTKQMAEIPKHHTKKRRDCLAMHLHAVNVSVQDLTLVYDALKTARYDIVTNWNWDD